MADRHSLGKRARVTDLATHDQPFVTPEALANYFGVSRRYIHKIIETGDLPAVRIGVRSFRVSTNDALNFESRLNDSADRGKDRP